MSDNSYSHRNEVVFYNKCINSFMDGLILELSLHPKPGLVTPVTTNIHKDMDFFTMFHSLQIIREYLEGLFELCRTLYKEIEETDTQQELTENYDPHFSYFSILQRETMRFIHWGVISEKKLLAQSSGVNTYKGILFTFGLLFIAYYIFSELYGKIENEEYDPVYNITKYTHIKSFQHVLTNVGRIITTIKRDTHQISSESFSMQVYGKYNVKGIFEEAMDGYPVIFAAVNHYLHLKTKYSFSTIIDNQLSFDFKRALLLNLFSFCSMNISDSNIIRKAGIEVFNNYHKMISEIAESDIDQKVLEKINTLNDYCLKNNISPGGTADLFAGILVVLKLFEQL